MKMAATVLFAFMFSSVLYDACQAAYGTASVFQTWPHPRAYPHMRLLRLDVPGSAGDMWQAMSRRLQPFCRESESELMLAWHARRYGRLKWLRDSNLITVNCALVRVVSLLRLAPAGMQDVHDMLVRVSLSLVQVRLRSCTPDSRATW